MIGPQMPAAVSPRLLLTVEEAAEVLAISRTTLYVLLRAGEIPVIHIGRSVRVQVAAVEAYVARLSVEQEA